MNDIEYLKKYYKGNMDDALKKISENIPVQYIVGNVDFYGFNFNINKQVLIPRFETEQLIEYTLEYAKEFTNPSILDIGTGSGCIAITLNKLIKNSKVDAIDISSDALVVAKVNNDKMKANVKFFQSDIFSDVNKTYDIIISNPPYIKYDEDIMPVVKNNEPHIALYAADEGLYFYNEILKLASNYLNEKFLIAFEIGQTQSNAITKQARKYFKNIKITVKKDLNGFDRFLFIERDYDEKRRNIKN